MLGFGRPSSDKTSSTTSERRRKELRRNLPRPSPEIVDWLRRPELVATLLITFGCALAITVLITLSREASRAFTGQLAVDSRINPREYSIEDLTATTEARENAHRASPRFYVANGAYLSSVRAAIEGLPVATFEKLELSAIEPELVNRFDLTQTALKDLQRYGGPKTASESWREWSERFIGLLWSEEPIVSSQEYQVFATTRERRVLPPPSEPVAAAGASTPPVLVAEAKRVEIAHELPPGEGPVEDDFRRGIARLVREAGFPEPFVNVVAAAVISDPRPTISFDDARTSRAAADAAARVAPVMEKHPRGEVIVAEGDVLSADTLRRLEQSGNNAADLRTWRETFAMVGGGFGFGLAVAVLILLYAVRHEPRVGRSPIRLTSVFLLMVVPASLATLTSSAFPVVTLPTAAAAALFVSAVAAVAYGQRFALFVGALQSLLLTITLDLEETTCLVFFLGCGTLVTLLREVRHRATIVRASGGTAIVLFIGFLLLGLFETRFSANAWTQTLRDAFLGAVAAYAIGFLVLGVLPSIEKLFNITTGLTLAELRDPRHPLLRQMQERAPGTYSHSLQVANLAEAAADAIGADGLLAYAGSLYHDIGKVNKPEYFVENQLGAANKHERLSPAMSLLVIVGHVKDGLELAKEYVLPSPLHHFIESHHGTTLVEYFFHRARTEAERKGESEDSVEEFEFRYPGPKPRTKEAAILMLSDASESASRAIVEPTHGRIEHLVRTLARKRLDDGQFDECPLTFAELKIVEDSLIKSLAAIHHGRIAYPSTATTIAARA